MSTSDKKFAAVYQYDPLDRLIAASTAQRFYNNTRIATEIEGTVKRSLFEHDARPLAQQQAGTTTLLATDTQASVLHSVSTAQSAPHAYSPYGHRPVANGLLSVLGFNGERPDPLSGYYLLGQGYRAFNPVLMRFNSPDSFSPFGDGGINAYAYCAGDPINSSDPTGHWRLPKFLRNLFKSGKSANKPNDGVAVTSLIKLGNDLDETPVVRRPRTETQPSTGHNDSMHAAREAVDEIMHHERSIKAAQEDLVYVGYAEKRLGENFTANDYVLNNARGFMKRSPDEAIENAHQERSKLIKEKHKLQSKRKAINKKINSHYQKIDNLTKTINIRKNQ